MDKSAPFPFRPWMRQLACLVLLSALLGGCKLTINAGNGGQVNAGIENGTACVPDCQVETAEDGGAVYVAVADPGYVFEKWQGTVAFCEESGEGGGNSNQCTIKPFGPLGIAALDEHMFFMEAVFKKVDNDTPAISCDDPIDGAMLSQAPGDVLFHGTVTDTSSGISHFELNTLQVPVGPDGTFEALVPAVWGTNFIELIAVDGVGNESRRTCSFLLSENWAQENALQADMISTALRQEAIDDANRNDPLDSGADVLHTVLNSPGLHTELHNALISSNPLKPNACDSESCAFSVCVCWLRSEMTYLDSSITGPNTTSLNLVDGGLRSTTSVPEIKIRIRVKGAVAGIGYDTTGWATFGNNSADMTFDTALANGLPHLTVRNESVSMGSLSTSFSGIDGAVIDLVTSLFNGTIRNMVRDLVRDWLGSSFSDILDGLIAEMDVRNLAPAYTLPRLDGGGSLAVNFDTSFSSLNTNTSRLLAGMGTRFTSAPAHSKPSYGAAIPEGPLKLDAASSSPISVAMNVGAIDQVLHALWRGGYFDLALHPGDLDGAVPAGVSMETDALLPPTVQAIEDGRLQLSLGAAQTTLVHPLLGDPVSFSVGGRISCLPVLLQNSGELSLDDCNVDEIYVSHNGDLLAPQIQVALESLLSKVINDALVAALNNAFPAVPLPSLVIPEAVGDLGLPAGEELGVLNPQIRVEGNHLILEGDFGIQ